MNPFAVPNFHGHRTLPRHAVTKSFIVSCLSVLWVAPLAAADARNLADLTIEQLLNESITSVSKKEQRLGDAAAAVSVITNEDLRRSGVTTIPDALRMVPGMEVAAVNAGQWAISSRGFNDGFANKLLVLMDGRALYTPLFSGVHWDVQQTLLEDVDQIEVIRGPGATLWGANAMNGVINIVTRSAKDTQGGLIYAGAGNVHEAMGGVRYGGKLGNQTYFRVFGTYQEHDANVLPAGSRALDAWQTLHGGIRIDREMDAEAHATWQAGVTQTDFAGGESHSLNLNTLARWTRTWAHGTSLELQGYLDRTEEDEGGRARPTIDTADLTLQHNFEAGRHAIVWGFGYRATETRVVQTNPFVLVRHGRFVHGLANAFIQDELTVIPDQLTLTAGLKFEHNDFTGMETQPSLRGAFKPSPTQTVWVAVSRAVRTPSEIEYEDVLAVTAGPPFRGPDGNLYQPYLVGNNQLRSETMWAYQAGYRAQVGPRASVDVALFYNCYDQLANRGSVVRLIPGVPLGIAEVAFSNFLHGQTYGGEAALNLSLTSAWRVSASYSALQLWLDGPATPLAPDFETGSPKHQVKLHTAYDFSPRASVDAQFRYVDHLISTPAYFTADLRFSYRPNEATELSLVGQNLLDNHHAEHSLGPLTTFTESRRGFYVKIARRF